MSFDYDRAKKHSAHGSDSMWTSYSDLFLMLSIVFLLLYVTASLKTQTHNLHKNQEYQQLANKAKDLEEQINVYNALKEEQLRNSGAKEQEVYQKLMDKLSLLKDEAKQEKDALRRQAKENEEKEYALNEYQQIIRNIINTNILAKTQIKRREQIIVKKDVRIGEQKQVIAANQAEIANLNEDIAKKQRNLEANRRRIKEINAALDAKVQELTQEQKNARSSREALSKKIAALRKQSQQKIAELETQSQAVMQELNQAQNELQSVQTTLEDVKTKSAAERAALTAKLQNTRAQYENEMSRLQAEHDARVAREKAAFEAQLGKERLNAAERQRRLAAFAAEAKKKEAELAGKLGELGAKIGQTQAQLAAAESERGRLAGEAARLASEKDRLAGEKERLSGETARLAGENEGLARERERLAAEKARLAGEKEGLQRGMASLSGELKRAQEIANARKELAKKIQGELNRAGLKGTVDGKTGDVTLAFGEEYFDTGSADLKPTMMKTLERFVPGYSKSLFSDSKIAQQIENVEIIGFASSTYKGRYVPPDSLRPEDQEAVNYNLKLSFNRANAIFKHIFDTKRMSFEHQKELLPRIKVVGRGYLPDNTNSKEFAKGMPESQFCKMYNCKAAQKVIIKFKLKD